MSAIFPVEYDRFSRGVSPLGQSLAQPGNPTVVGRINRSGPLPGWPLCRPTAVRGDRTRPHDQPPPAERSKPLSDKMSAADQGAAETRSPSSSPRPVKDVEVGLLRVARDPPGINPAPQTTQALLGYHI
ncbi:unnamed protein product [Arctogadus glacialis]